MQHRLRLRSHKIAKLQNSQRGYMMITLMLAVALMAIALLAVVPSIRLQTQRDREEELQHRGTAYMRAIQHFYKKFNRYPMRVEELENTNNLHFLRKRYKDPVNRDAQGKEKDFKFLHQQDITLNNGPVLGPTPGPNLPGQNNLPNSPNGLPNALGGPVSILGGGQPNTPTATPTSENGDSANSAESDANNNVTGSSSGPTSGSTSTSGFNGPALGGGPILGVASLSKEKTVRVFFQKSHYNDWLFIYVPQADRGGLLTGPVNPGMPQGNLNGGPPGQPGQPAPGTTPNPAVQNPPITQPQTPVQNPDQ